jgi:hypothetical protein
MQCSKGEGESFPWNHCGKLSIPPRPASRATFRPGPSNLRLRARYPPLSGCAPNPIERIELPSAGNHIPRRRRDGALQRGIKQGHAGLKTVSGECRRAHFVHAPNCDWIGIRKGQLIRRGFPCARDDLHVVERYRLIDYEVAKEAVERAGKENVRIAGWAPKPNYRGKGSSFNSRSKMKASSRCPGRPP